MTTREIMIAVKSASRFVAGATTDEKNRALIEIADSIEKATDAILEANKYDMDMARGIISDVMLDRLMLSVERIKAMADGIRHVVSLEDPVGRVLSTHKRDDGLEINKVASAIGVVAINESSLPAK